MADLKHGLNALSIVLIVASLILVKKANTLGKRTAAEWSKASNVDDAPASREQSGDEATAQEDAIAGIQRASIESAALNRTAADFSREAVLYGTCASVSGIIAGVLSIVAGCL